MRQPRSLAPPPGQSLLRFMLLLLLIPAAFAAAAHAAESPPFTLVRAFTTLPVHSPTHLGPSGDGSGRLFLAEKSGIIRVYHPARQDTGAIFIDLQPQALDFRPETGLLGLAFHPGFAANGRFFVHYSGESYRTVLSEFRVSRDDPDRADPEERVLLEVPQPTDSHNGGHIEFGPDGYLYMGIGDGGGPEGEPRYDHGQDLTTLLGTILRIDVDSVEEGYAIPADNPFAGNDRGWREEIWAYGLRNPWSFSFDPVSGLIWVGDVGERNREEIDLVERGGNYGWARMEGNLCRDPEGCDDSLIPPVFEYGREEGLAVIGGFVYQGSRWPGLAGRYLFGDFGTRRLWALRRDGEAWSSELLAVADEHILAFGRDAEEELYVLARKAVYRLESAAGRELPPPRLSETGVFSSMRSQEPASRVMPYEVNAPLWSDGAGKKRYLVLPEEGRIRFRSDGAWEFPDGTVLVKSFYVGELIAETRLLIKRTGYPGWDGYSYKWNADRNEAFLLEVAATGEYSVSSPDGARTHQHYFPSRGQCGDCHTPASGYVLGLRTGQMNRDGLIEAWEREGLFDGGLPPPREWAKWPEPADESLPLERRARAYLAANCANCHRPGHGIRAVFDLRFDTPVAETGVLESARLGDLGVQEARIVERGEPQRSLLYLRMLETGRWRMPPLATALVDTLGARLVGSWIERLGDPTAVEVALGEQTLPREFALLPPYPNPANASLSIPFVLDASGEVRLELFNLAGQRVEMLWEGVRPAGRHLLRWDSGGRASGVYVVRLTGGGRMQSRKVMLLR